ncbi:MAG TPA: hypothetical protein VMX56_09555, partial [Anaerolineales bacterium]|nr:hypothetical protein [Anaerolineales bacterium]
MATVLDGSRCELYQPPTVKKFTSRHADEMGRYLRELDASTTVMTFVDVAELQLDERTWRTRSGGYQYTTGGFSQVAQIAAPGLSKLLPDIAG